MQDPRHHPTPRLTHRAGRQGNIFSFRSRDKNILDIPSYRSGHIASMRLPFARPPITFEPVRLGNRSSALDCKRNQTPAHVFRATPVFPAPSKLIERRDSIYLTALAETRDAILLNRPDFPLWGSAQNCCVLPLRTASVMEVSAMVKSVLIADDQEVIRRMLCFLFASQSDFEVCGEAENGLEAIEMARVLHPDL